MIYDIQQTKSQPKMKEKSIWLSLKKTVYSPKKQEKGKNLNYHIFREKSLKGWRQISDPSQIHPQHHNLALKSAFFKNGGVRV